MSGIQLRRSSKKGMRFMLMPLVDVIFLLLTFFMLSSKLAPYSALTLGDYHREGCGLDGDRRSGAAATRRHSDPVGRRGARQRDDLAARRVSPRKPSG